MDDRERDMNQAINRRPGGSQRPDRTSSEEYGQDRRPARRRSDVNQYSNLRSGAQRRSANPNNRNRMRAKRARRRKRNIKVFLLLLLLLVIGVAGGLFVWQRYGPSNEMADLNEYYGIESEEQMAVIINNEVIRDDETGNAVGRIIDGEAYVEYSVVRQSDILAIVE